MAHYIDKDALVAKIERLISNGQTKLKESEECKDYENYVAWAERIATCINVLSLLDTLEVKEVDLEKEIDKFYGIYRKNGKIYSIKDNEECVDWKVDCNPDFEIAFAKHFLKAMKWSLITYVMPSWELRPR